MLLNKIIFPAALDTEIKKINALKVLAFADDVNILANFPSGNLTGLDAAVRYIPEGVTFGLTYVEFQWVVKRQDAKSVNIIPLSTATVNEGLIVNENEYGSSSESFFTNSFLVAAGDQNIRVGVSNFTQTVDNNPFSALTSAGVLYYQIS